MRLWPSQRKALAAMRKHRLLCALKARQLGFTWMALGDGLQTVLYQPGSTVLLFSLRDTEAKDLLRRMKDMHRSLPAEMRRPALVDSSHDWRLGNGSRVMAFPTTAGDSYSASLVVVDEADLVPDLNRLLRSVKPTIDAGGRLLLISRADKSKPQSTFKQIYRSAKAGESSWHPFFLPWNARPDRDAAWYESQRQDSLARTGALDDLWEQYPETDEQALAPATLDKRLPLAWLEECYTDSAVKADGPSIPGLAMYTSPASGRDYVIGADAAEGNPTSDDSAAVVLDAKTLEQVAALSGKFQPDVLAAHCDSLGRYYNGAGILPERNNHGHAVILWLRDNSNLRILKGDDDKPGWLSSGKGKAVMYDAVAEVLRDRAPRVRDYRTFVQLSLIEGASLRAPAGEHDDLADSFALAVVAARQRPRSRLSGGNL